MGSGPVTVRVLPGSTVRLLYPAHILHTDGFKCPTEQPFAAAVTLPPLTALRLSVSKGKLSSASSPHLVPPMFVLSLSQGCHGAAPHEKLGSSYILPPAPKQGIPRASLHSGSAFSLCAQAHHAFSCPWKEPHSSCTPSSHLDPKPRLSQSRPEPALLHPALWPW